jgi:hypothetical protein
MGFTHLDMAGWVLLQIDLLLLLKIVFRGAMGTITLSVDALIMGKTCESRF